MLLTAGSPVPAPGELLQRGEGVALVLTGKQQDNSGGRGVRG